LIEKSTSIKKYPLFLSIYQMEWRNILSYRMDFWLNFFGTTLVQITIAYFLWSSIFTYTQKESIGGFSFKLMMIYYLLAPLCYKVIAGLSINFIFPDIYDGGLNKYLIYPVSYLKFKLIAHFARTTYYFFQLILVLSLFTLIFGLPHQIILKLPNLIAMLGLLALGSYLYFMMASCLEMTSFWADNVWSLLIMLRSIIYFLGGLILPLSLFPDWAQNILQYLPFSTLLSYPTLAFLGQLTPQMISQAYAVSIFWSIFFTLLANLIWTRGVKSYSGIGI
jgi:ABC-2 type transport system permease protein